MGKHAAPGPIRHRMKEKTMITHTCLHGPNYLTQGGCKAIVSVTPSPGWHGEWVAPDGSECSQPLVGWGVQCNGEVVPLEADGDGSVSKLSENSRCVYREPDIGPRALDALEAIYMGFVQFEAAVR